MYRGKKSVFWAIMLILLAAALLASRLGYLEGIGFWPILFSAIFVAFVINGKESSGPFFSPSRS